MTSTDNSSDVQNQQQQQQHLQQKQQQQPRIELDKPSQSSGDSEKTQTKPSRPKRKKPGFHDDMFQETSYYFKNGNNKIAGIKIFFIFKICIWL